MAQLFIAVKPYSDCEGAIVKLGAAYKERMGVLLGEIVGYDANFYQISKIADNDLREEAIKIIDLCSKYDPSELYRVTATKDNCTMADFVKYAIIE